MGLVEDKQASNREQQSDVFFRCLRIYEERARLRGELWKQFPITDKIHHMEGKLARIKVGLELADDEASLAEVIDEALDLINYAAFFVRQAEERKNGA